MEIFNAFSKDRYIAQNVTNLKNEFNLNIGIETGTLCGNTTEWMSDNFEKVHSVECNLDNYTKCKEKLKEKLNINLHLGDSVEFVKEMVSIYKDEKCLFYLDAHGTLPTPTPIELKEIIKMNVKPCIVIHDFYVPNTNFNYDVYSDFDSKVESIKDILDLIYDKKYEYYYNSITDPEGYNVGCIFIKPKILT